MEISRVLIFTTDVERLARFYASAFGLSERGLGTSEWTELDAGGCRLAFHKIDEQGTGRDGWIKVVFGTANVAVDKSRLEGLGVQMSDIVRFGDIELCDGRDPDGNWFQLSSRGMIKDE
ncbi:MAG TPA: VOC family protein [Pyrinomonadaceae bacterium]|nr:VOC family protein [Pyrinomonadaceae bacterium]